MKRKIFWQDNLDGTTNQPKRQRLVYDIKEANLISSDVGGGMHSPVLDIDFPCRLIPSSTPGHYHLYLDGMVMPWQRYVRFLNMLAKFGVIERGFAGISIKRRRSTVRLPHIKKGFSTTIVSLREPELSFDAPRPDAFLMFGEEPFDNHVHDFQIEYLPDYMSNGSVIESGDSFCTDCQETHLDTQRWKDEHEDVDWWRGSKDDFEADESEGWFKGIFNMVIRRGRKEDYI